MKHLILVSALLALAPIAVAQTLYKSIDKDGKTVYSDMPPANTDSKQLKVQPGPVADAPAPAKTALEKNKELEKGRKEVAEKAKKNEQEAKRTQDNEERCANARSNLRAAEAARRPTRVNDKGETEFLDDREFEALKDQRRADVDKACKTS